MALKERIGDFWRTSPVNSRNLTLEEDVLLSVEDDEFFVTDPADETKRVRFDVSLVPTATTRVFRPGEFPVTTVAAGDLTLTEDLSGTTFLATAASGTQTFTLPAAAEGLQFSFVCGHASGEILITPVTGDAIRTMAFGAIGADADTAAVAPAAGTGIKNTAATNVIGDNITLRCLDGTTWQGMGIAVGIWASQ